MQALNRQFLHEHEVRRDLYYSAPYAPFCSDNKTAGFQLPRRDAFKRQYVQLNPPCNYKVFIIDIDHEDESLWDNEETPIPNVIIRNKNNRKVHLLYRIDDVLIKTVNSDVIVKDGPIQYAKAVYYGLCKKLGADRAAFNNVVSKNPFHPAFNTEFIHSRVYKLKELAEFATPDWSVYKRGDKENPNPESRNLSLFHKVRFAAYNQVQRYRLANDMEGFYKAVLAECELENKFRGKGFKEDSDLPSSQVKAIAKSIATFSWNKYQGSKGNRGVMSLPHDMDQKEKQRQAALYVANKKRERTLGEILKAFEEVARSGAKPTQERVASSCSHYSLSTIKRYWKEVKESYESRTDSSEGKVQLAVHKVSFPRKALTFTPDVTFKYNICVFRLNRFKAELDVLPNLSDLNKEFVSRYRLDTQSGRLIESGSDLNIQTLKKGIRNELFKGWYEIDLTFSHGQMLGTLLRESFDLIQSKVKSLNDNGTPYGCFIDPIESYMHFILNMPEYFNSWSARSSLNVKSIKRGLVALMNGASEFKLNNIYDGKLNTLLSDIAFFEVFTCIRLAHKYIPSLSLKLRMLELDVFKPYWGKGLVIHDSILVQSNDLATEIANRTSYKHTFHKL